MRALKLYSKYLKRKLAYENILKELKDECLRELKRTENGKAVVDGVEYHLTKKVERKYMPNVEEELKKLRKMIDEIKELEEKEGRVILKEKETFDSYIPASSLEAMLAEVPEYRKFFGIKL